MSHHLESIFLSSRDNSPQAPCLEIQHPGQWHGENYFREERQMNIDPHERAASNLFRRSGIRYEVACDCIGAVIAHYSSVVGVERSSVVPDNARIDRAEELMAELRDIREAVDPADAAQIEGTIERLAPLARLVYLDLQEGTQEARRAAEFEQANHSLALDGVPPGIDDLAIQARVILGTMCHEQAVGAYRGRAAS